MNRIHALLITLIVGAAVAVGGVALSRSGADSAAAQPQTVLNDPVIAQRAKALDALETELDKKLVTPLPPPALKVRTVRAQAPSVAAPRHDDDEAQEYEDGDDD